MRSDTHINKLHKEGGVSQNYGQGRSQGANLLVAEIQELIELNATVGEGSEGPFFLELSGEMGVRSVSHCWYVKCGLEV